MLFRRNSQIQQSEYTQFVTISDGRVPTTRKTTVWMTSAFLTQDSPALGPDEGGPVLFPMLVPTDLPCTLQLLSSPSLKFAQVTAYLDNGNHLISVRKWYTMSSFNWDQLQE
ncbi:unnamed protein product [Cyclocybe aegerita]|uniref:Uncharacterized protein n=1 Tax=Cyclocybe aegerita TaxID=1973307 RepID=A0A8S0WL13_CYCAE|nr:unnamed protein product [Cyclocybe aegerita]